MRDGEDVRRRDRNPIGTVLRRISTGRLCRECGDPADFPHFCPEAGAAALTRWEEMVS